jgi:hypothetical protein
MMQEFSRRTAEGLRDHALFRLLLPAFQSFLDINVRKEVEKDRLVISSAAAAHRAGRAPDASDTQRLLQQARDIDQAFLRQAALFPIAISIQYSDIEQIRQRRIQHLLDLAYRLFVQWENTPRLRIAIANIYDREQFRPALREIFHLYGLETKMLSHSVRIPQVFTLAREKLAQTIYSVMETAAEELASELTRQVYRRTH